MSVLLAAGGLPTHPQAPLLLPLAAGAALLFVAVMLLLARAVLGAARPVGARWWLLGGGLLLPCAVLLPLGIVSLRDLQARHAPAPADALVVGLSARPWWWQLRVPGPAGGPEVVLANELVLPVGRPVRLALASESLIHSLWVPALGAKMDLVPGRINHLLLQAGEPGRWRAPCAEFCGSGHTQMVLHVVALAPTDYDAWLAAQAAPARAPATPLQQRGRELFGELRCSHCHTVRGQFTSVLGHDGPADESGGPDLTHVASRRWLAAGVLRNDADGLRRWLRLAPRLKPGTRMPSYEHLDEATLDALVDYLGHLR